MKIEHKSYSTHYYNPNPATLFDKANKIVLISFCWGNKIDNDKYLELIFNYYTSQTNDLDSTRPVPLKSDLDFHENCIRSSIVAANNHFFNAYNKDEYSVGLELFMGVQVGHAFYFTSTGQPNLILNRDKIFKNVSVTPDLSSEFSLKNEPLSPLPKKLFGTHLNQEFLVNKFHCRKNDQLLLIKRAHLIRGKYPRDQISLDELSSLLIKDNKELPFWIANILLD